MPLSNESSMPRSPSPDQAPSVDVERVGSQRPGAPERACGTGAGEQTTGISDVRRETRNRGMGFHFLIELDGDDRPVGARSVAMMDSSPHGCGLYQVGPESLGTRCGIVFAKPGRWSASIAEVRHCTLQSNGWTLVGLQFVQSSPETLAALVELVQRMFGDLVGTRKSA